MSQFLNYTINKQWNFEIKNEKLESTLGVYLLQPPPAPAL